MKHILILISILLLSCPVIGEDTGILFFREVEGKWLWFEDGNKDKDVIYRGEFKDGWFEDIQPNGQGSISYPNGRNYDGEWKDGKKYGQGTLTIPNGEKYVGEFKNGVPNGQGTTTFPDGRKYVGEHKNNKRNGQGIMTLPDGKKYVGEYKNGKTWNGTFYDKNGNILFMVKEHTLLLMEVSL